MAGRLQLNDFLVEWDSDCHQDLLWWSDISHLQVGMPLGESLPDLCLFTGWGASLGDVHLFGSWSPLSSRFSINHRELLAVLLALRGFLPSLRGRVVAVFSDNTTALAYLKKQGGTRSATLNTVAQSVLRFCEDFHIQLLLQFIPGKMKVLADSLSRRKSSVQNGFFVRRRFTSFFASGQPPSTSLRPPSITGCRFTSLRWWTLSRHVPAPCSRVGMAFRLMPFLPSASFLGSWRRSDSPKGWS